MQQIDSLPQASQEEIKEILVNHGMSDDEIESIEARNRQMAEAQGGSILRKNKREIQRLNLLAQGAVLENNYPSYEYAIKKLRKIYRQPYNDELIQVGWQTTRKQVWELLNDKES